MTYTLNDIFIGNFKLNQLFGGNPSRYSSFNIKGHNGIDFSMPVGSQVVSASDGWVREVGFDPGGFGKYVKVVHNGFFTLYAHLDQIFVHQNDRVVSGQLLGLSGNTGNTSGPHLHFGVAPCDAQGAKLVPQNGYSGYINPLLAPCKWVVRGLAAPVTPPTPDALPGKNSDELRALTVLYQALPVLKQENGQLYGSLEGLARDLVAIQVAFRASQGKNS